MGRKGEELAEVQGRVKAAQPTATNYRGFRTGDVRRNIASPQSYGLGTPQRGTASYGYYEEVRIIAIECYLSPHR